MRKAFTKELHQVVGVGAECSYDDLRRVADRVECSLSDFQTMLDDMRNNGLLLKKPDGRYQVLS
jgi:DNA-binding IclR family transcriptional regulator